jgi:hypothetical protein
VTPLGELVATQARGLVYGNRGCLHDEEGTIRRGWNGKRWIACRLEFRGRRRERLLQPGRYTELFFLDEATALAAGHRPCAECRRADYVHFMHRWPGRGADDVDALLHEERLDGRSRRVHRADYRDLPTGTFVLVADEPWLVLDDELRRWTVGGYAERGSRPAHGPAALLTPPLLVDLLRTAREPLVPFLHPSARVSSAGGAARPAPASRTRRSGTR